MTQFLPVGKLPPDVLERLLAQAPTQDPHIVLGPGIGIDCAVIEVGDTLLVVKSDPITFATDAIGWYVVQVTSNDLATTGATPRWLLITMLLPEARTTAKLVERISQDVYRACREIGIAVIGGHTEITARLDRPILVGTLIGEVEHDRLVTPQGARAGDRILLTKGESARLGKAMDIRSRDLADPRIGVVVAGLLGLFAFLHGVPRFAHWSITVRTRARPCAGRSWPAR